MTEIFVEKCFEIEDDFQNIFLSKSGIHVTPVYKELRLSERTINSIHYNDLFIIEPKKYYYISFKSNGFDFIKYENSFIESGLIISVDNKKNRFYIYNATENMIYIQQGMKIGEVSNG